MEKITTYKVEVTRIDKQQYEKKRVFYVEDGQEYSYDGDGRKRHVEETGELGWNESKDLVYEQSVENLDLKALIKAVNPD